MSQPPFQPPAGVPAPTPQEGFPPAAPPGFAAPAPGVPPKKKSNALKIVLIILAALLVLCLGGAAAVYYAAKDEIQGAVQGAVAAQNTRLVTPETLGDRKRINEPELQAASDMVLGELKKSLPGATSTVAGFYGDLSQQDMVMVAGASAAVVNPEKELDSFISGMSTGGMTVTNAAPVDPGPLGGVAKCGDAKGEVPMGVCVWADNGSVAMIALYFKGSNDLKAQFVEMRGQIEQRS